MTFAQWLVEAGFELDSPRMWPEDYEALHAEWKKGADPYEYVGSKPRPLEPGQEDKEDLTPKVGSVVRYYDRRKNAHVEARVVKIQPFNAIFGGDNEGMYLELDNTMGVHEDQCKVIFP